MDRIKRLSMEILNEHKEKFGTDFIDNKKTLNDISIVRSKELKNEIAGFITKFIKREIRHQEIKEQLAKEDSVDEEPVTQTQTKPEVTETPKETPAPEPETPQPEPETPAPSS